VELEGGRGSESGERQAGMQMGGLEVNLGNFRIAPLCMRVLVFERERMRMSASGWDGRPWASIIVFLSKNHGERSPGSNELH
jgi:hypothetical protein